MDGSAAGPVVGIDGCRSGWVGVVLADGKPPRGVHGADIGALMAAAGKVAVVAIDMPLHLTDGAWPRPCDLAARARLGRRAGTLFVVPPARAYAAPTYAAACALCRELTGRAPSRQAWALGPKIAEVEAWHAARPGEVYEVHPEVAFAAMTGAPIAARKVTWAGAAARRAALAAEGIVVPDDIGPAGLLAGSDDVLDAAAVAWTARRIASGSAMALGSVELGEGCVQAIWA
jgi:predicted RNase H-like nuclease